MAQINKPNQYFNTKLYTGNGGGSGSSTGIGFQPDMVWSKSRTEALNHTMFDSVRGAGSNKELTPNGASAEGGANSAGFGFISAFNSDGYSWTAGSTNTENFNKSSQNYANWCWKANGSASSNTDGSITSTVSANTTSGFSIGTYTANGTTGATIGHGLSQKPNFILVKNRTSGSTNNWAVYHSSTGASNGGTLDNPQAFFSNTTYWNGTEPTSSVFTIGSSGIANTSGNDYVFYCFAEKKGFSKFGSYTGNGSTDGTFIYTGFKPAFILVKQTNSTASWTILDNKRDSFNVTEKRLFPDDANEEVVSANGNTDFLSNGVKMRIGHANINASGSTYIYMAFAENPLVGTNNIPTTAR